VVDNRQPIRKTPAKYDQVDANPPRSTPRIAAGRWFPDRVWAVEGCAGIGRHIAQRLVADLM
jgi:hypothetical protein